MTITFEWCTENASGTQEKFETRIYEREAHILTKKVSRKGNVSVTSHTYNMVSHGVCRLPRRRTPASNTLTLPMENSTPIYS